jgi:hypothetical protein
MSVVIRAMLIVIAMVVTAALGLFANDAYWRHDAAMAVRTAIDEYLSGKQPLNLVFLTKETGYPAPLDLEQFTADVRTGYDLASGPMWTDFNDVEIRTTNGKSYIASPIWSTGYDPNNEQDSFWLINCCEVRN